MSSFGYFQWLVSECAGWAMLMGYITIPAFVMALLAILINNQETKVSLRRIVIGSLLPAVIPVMILLLGVAFVDSGAVAFTGGPPQPWFDTESTGFATGLCQMLLISHFPLAIILAAWLKERAPIALFTSLWWASISLVANAVANMSITGGWI